MCFYRLKLHRTLLLVIGRTLFYLTALWKIDMVHQATGTSCLDIVLVREVSEYVI